MWYGEFGIWLWVISTLILWVGTIIHLRRSPAEITTLDLERIEVVRRFGGIQRFILWCAVVGFGIAWLMFIPFLYIVFNMPHH